MRTPSHRSDGPGYIRGEDDRCRPTVPSEETCLSDKGHDTMNTKQLGNSDLCITPIGFGAWAVGGSGWEFGWGAQDDPAPVAAIHAALDAGVNWIDTAAVYGLGHSEEVVARALDG